jgi:ferredoxin
MFVRGGIEFDSGVCLRGLNLLAHAQMIELPTGSRCGGHGKCGADRVILDPESQKQVNPPSPIERHQLSPEELSRGLRLACQTFPGADGLSIRVLLDSTIEWTDEGQSG